MHEAIKKASTSLLRGTSRARTASSTPGGNRSRSRFSFLRHIGIAALAASFVTIHGHSVAAQQDTQSRGPKSVAISVTQARPLGALAGNIGSGYGLVGSFLLPLDRDGLLSLRADLGVVEYGHDTKRTPFSQSVGGRVQVNVRTTNFVVPGSIGIQLTPSLGPIDPYINAGVGAQAFYTESSVQPTSSGVSLATTMNHSDVALAWTLGGGLYVPITESLGNVVLDISVQYIHGGNARYLAPGSIIDGDDGQVAIAPMESTTHLLALRLGARIGL